MDNYKKKHVQLTFSDIDLTKKLFGERDINLKTVADMLDVNIQSRGNTAYIIGDNVNVKLVCNIFNQLYDILKSGYPVYFEDVNYAVRILSENNNIKLKDMFLDTICID